ncbi:hypothetical protein SFRURICE_013043 [Spodoptera frugiperda]|nr:hypothetical protein SFRURICE_013043 [Spodoptera frugiperda]
MLTTYQYFMTFPCQSKGLLFFTRLRQKEGYVFREYEGKSSNDFSRIGRSVLTTALRTRAPLSLLHIANYYDYEAKQSRNNPSASKVSDDAANSV